MLVHTHILPHGATSEAGIMTQRQGLFKTLRKLWMSEKFVWFRKLVEDVEVPEMLEKVEIAH